MHKFQSYGGIRHIQLVLDKDGLYSSHSVEYINTEELLTVLGLDENTVHPVPESFTTNEDPGDYESALYKKKIPGFGKILNVVVNNIPAHQTVPNSAKMIFGKGGRWVTYWGSPIMPYLYILDVTVK